MVTPRAGPISDVRRATVLAMNETVRVSHDSGYPPFAEIKDGKSEGLAVDILRAAAARAGVDMIFVPVPFEQRQLTLEDGRADAYFPSLSRPNVSNCSILATC